MSNYIVTDTELTATAEAVRQKGGTSTLIPWQAGTGFADAVGAIPSGGATITDGIVVKARDANGFPTEVDVYGELYQCQFSYEGQYYHNTIGWKSLDKINLKSNQTNIPDRCFSYLPITQMTGTESIIQTEYGAFSYCKELTSVDFLPNLSTSGSDLFSNCTSLVSAYLPSLTYINGKNYYSLFLSCTALQDVQIGSIGHGITYIKNGFRGCTQTGLTITAFTTDSYADTVVSNIRSGATNATIIIKASEATTYNGTSYAAGDTILTSEVTS